MATSLHPNTHGPAGTLAAMKATNPASGSDAPEPDSAEPDAPHPAVDDLLGQHASALDAHEALLSEHHARLAALEHGDE